MIYYVKFSKSKFRNSIRNLFDNEKWEIIQNLYFITFHILEHLREQTEKILSSNNFFINYKTNNVFFDKDITGLINCQNIKSQSLINIHQNI